MTDGRKHGNGGEAALVLRVLGPGGRAAGPGPGRGLDRLVIRGEAPAVRLRELRVQCCVVGGRSSAWRVNLESPDR